MDPKQCRAARAMLAWSVRDLAHHAGITPNTISSFELGRPARASTVDRLRDVLMAYGVVFNPETGGVHLLPPAPPCDQSAA